MFVIRLVLKNSLRHKLRTLLTVLGIAIAVLAFGVLRTIVTAWSSGVEASAANRMITRHAVSFILPLPLAYRDQIARTPGVESVTYASWFQGSYKDPNEWSNFFPRFAVDANTFFQIYAEFLIPPGEMETFLKERNACVIGEKLSRDQKLAIGDQITIEGDIFPGQWTFVVRAIYKGKDATTDETQMFFHWEYLNERLREDAPGRANQVGWYVMKVQKPEDMARIAQAVDALYENSRASTKTESEREFQQGFVSMSSAIITSLEAVSYIVILIILLVLANTIVMAARERTKEYAVLKTIGFSSKHLAGLIGGESLLIGLAGSAVGLALTIPAANGVGAAFPTMFPVFAVQSGTMIMSVAIGLLAGLVAAAFPVLRTLHTSIANGLRSIG
jgi:putative ABC transport system permease protein